MNNQNWRDIVVASDLMSEECAAFLDKHGSELKLSKGGLVHLKEPIGEMVPFEICPLRVKKIIKKIQDDGNLPRTLFKTNNSYQLALCNLFIYGYLQDIDKTLLEKRRATALAKRRWSEENPEAIRRYSQQGRKFAELNRAKMSRR